MIEADEAATYISESIGFVDRPHDPWPIGYIRTDTFQMLAQLYTHRPAVYGFVRYKDGLGIIRDMGFAMHPTRAVIADTFVQWGGSEYNYEKELKA